MIDNEESAGHLALAALRALHSHGDTEDLTPKSFAMPGLHAQRGPMISDEMDVASLLNEPQDHENGNAKSSYGVSIWMDLASTASDTGTISPPALPARETIESESHSMAILRHAWESNGRIDIWLRWCR